MPKKKRPIVHDKLAYDYLATRARYPERFRKDGKKDWAGEICDTIIAGHVDEIFEVFTKKVLEGDPRVLKVLADRAYGLPRQEVSFDQDKPFKLVIEHIGRPVEPVKRELPVAPAEVIEEGEHGE
jgi:hypothetical protein